MEAAGRRLGVMAAHLDDSGGASSSGGRAQSAPARSPAVKGLQHVLDHDSYELRDRMKAFFAQDPIYIPRCGRLVVWSGGGASLQAIRFCLQQHC